MNHFGYEPEGVSLNVKQLQMFVKKDQKIADYYEKWKRLGLGIEEFPVDPVDETNWERGLDD